MECEYGHTDCKNLNEKCYICVHEMHYVPIKIKTRPKINKRAMKQDKRQGSSFEYNNHKANENLLSGATTRMTPNSGAGRIKGDQEIQGLVEIMEELKTRIIEQAPGKKSFTIKKEWLDKLLREAKEADKEFWYLKFSFHEYDDDVYIIIEEPVLMSMVYTLVEDRKKVNAAQKRIDLSEKKARHYEAKFYAQEAEIEYLKAQLAQRKEE